MLERAKRRAGSDVDDGAAAGGFQLRGIAARQTCIGPVRLTASTRAHSSSLISRERLHQVDAGRS